MTMFSSQRRKQIRGAAQRWYGRERLGVGMGAVLLFVLVLPVAVRGETHDSQTDAIRLHTIQAEGESIPPASNGRDERRHRECTYECGMDWLNRHQRVAAETLSVSAEVFRACGRDPLLAGGQPIPEPRDMTQCEEAERKYNDLIKHNGLIDVEAYLEATNEALEECVKGCQAGQ